ncbi:MAG: SDR family oxidoreductase [Gemmatimonadetes bacterium]|nr:SDR family oxidoreductase [Gemmatimonadota bacterium]
MLLQDSRAVVTGGGRGIGAAVARALAEAGASVVVASRTESDIEQLASKLRAEGHQAWSVVCDVSDPQSIRELAISATDRLERVDILVNAAGIASSAPLHKLTLEDWNRVISVNATGTFLCTQAFISGMVERKWGRVVNVASVAGLTGSRYIAAYSASKHAVIGFTRCAAAEVAQHGVTVNAVCPGFVDTDMTAESLDRIVESTGISRDEALAAILDTTPQRRLFEPEEVAHAVLSLCDEKAKGINGQAIVLDGGGLLA